MKTIQILLMIPFLFILIGIGGCEDDEEHAELKGTTWKLAEYVNVETGKVEAEPEPKEDCGRCYTIDFITNTKGTGRSILNVIEIDLSNQPFFGGMTKIGDNEIGNVTLFYDAIRSIKSYTLERDELKFFYDEGQRYLLYKLKL